MNLPLATMHMEDSVETCKLRLCALYQPFERNKISKDCQILIVSRGLVLKEFGIQISICPVLHHQAFEFLEFPS